MVVCIPFWKWMACRHLFRHSESPIIEPHNLGCVLFSHPVVFDSLRPHGLQHTKLLLHCLPELAQTHAHRVGDAIQPSHPLSPPSPPTSSLSQHQGLFQCCYVWSKYSLLCNMFHDALHIQWPQYWSFSISPSNEYSGLISFRIDWYDLLAVQRTLKSLLQHQSLKVLILWHSAFFIVQLSYPFMTTGKTTALTTQTL